MYASVCDRGSHLAEGSVPGAATLATVTCRCSTVDEVASALSHLRSFQPALPRLITVLDVNGTSRWGETALQHSPAASVDQLRRSVDLILASNASINISTTPVFAGGTNFGMWNRAVEDAGFDSASVNVVRQVVRRRGRHGQRRGRLHRGNMLQGQTDRNQLGMHR